MFNRFDCKNEEDDEGREVEHDLDFLKDSELEDCKDSHPNQSMSLHAFRDYK